MLSIFQFFATKTDASALRMLNGSPAERLLKPIADYITAKGGRIHTRWGCRCACLCAAQLAGCCGPHAGSCLTHACQHPPRISLLPSHTSLQMHPPHTSLCALPHTCFAPSSHACRIFLALPLCFHSSLVSLCSHLSCPQGDPVRAGPRRPDPSDRPAHDQGRAGADGDRRCVCSGAGCARGQAAAASGEPSCTLLRIYGYAC